MTLNEQLQHLQKNKAFVDQLMQSQDGKKLLSLLTPDGGAQLKSAISAASTGNTSQMVHMVAKLMQSDEGAQIAQKINDQFQGK